MSKKLLMNNAKNYNIAYNLTNVTLSNSATTIKKDLEYTTTIIPNENYSITNVIVTMGGEDITSTVYTDGVITIPSVIGDIEIIVVAEEIVIYNIAYNLTNVTLDNTQETVIENQSYTATVTPTEGYEITSISIVMNGVDGTEVLFDTATNTINIPSVVGNVEITIVAEEVKIDCPLCGEKECYCMTLEEFKATELEVDFAIAMKYQNRNFSTYTSANKTYNGYDWYCVCSTGQSQTSYWDKFKTKMTELGRVNEKDYIILYHSSYYYLYWNKTLYGEPNIARLEQLRLLTNEQLEQLNTYERCIMPYHNVTYNLTNVTSSNTDTIAYEYNYYTYTTTITPTDGYSITNITVTMNGEDITSTVISYDELNRIITIPLVTGDIEITVIAKEGMYCPCCGNLEEECICTTLEELGATELEVCWALAGKYGGITTCSTSNSYRTVNNKQYITTYEISSSNNYTLFREKMTELGCVNTDNGGTDYMVYYVSSIYYIYWNYTDYGSPNKTRLNKLLAFTDEQLEHLNIFGKYVPICSLCNNEGHIEENCPYCPLCGGTEENCHCATLEQLGVTALEVDFVIAMKYAQITFSASTTTITSNGYTWQRITGSVTSAKTSSFNTKMIELGRVSGTDYYINSSYGSYYVNWNKTLNGSLNNAILSKLTSLFTEEELNQLNTYGKCIPVCECCGENHIEEDCPYLNTYVFDIVSSSTSSTARSITLQTDLNGDTSTYNYTDWGDGAVNTSSSHTYKSNGIYTVRTKYTFTDSSGLIASAIQDWLTEVKSLNINMTDLHRMFYQCDNLVTFKGKITNSVTNMNDMFYGCKALTEINSSDWDTSNVTTMYGMFYECSNLTSLDLSNFDTSNVTSIGSMFNRCNNLTSLDVSNFDTSNVTDMYGMFYNCNNLTSLDLSNWNTSNVTNMSYMFYNCNNLTSLDLSNFDTSKVTNMSYMFYNCNNLTSLDMSNCDVSKVTTLGDYMFDNCTALTDFKAPQNISVAVKFSECTNLTHDSLMSIINNLATVSSKKTLTLGSTNKAKLTDDEIAIATAKNWTVS